MTESELEEDAPRSHLRLTARLNTSAMDNRRGVVRLHPEVIAALGIREWDAVQQSAFFQKRYQDLTLLRLRIAPEFVPLVDDYRRAIETYLQKQKSSGSIFSLRRQSSQVPARVMEEAVRQFNALDERREGLRSAPQKPVAAATQNG